MSLTIGKGPFGPDPQGSFDFEPPDRVVYVERFPRRVRGVVEGATVIDSDDVLLVHETGALPHYAFPRDAVDVSAADDPHAEGHVHVDWDAVDAWYEEDERVFVHPRDPYHRIDSFSTSRRVTVSVEGKQIADSTNAVALYETGLPVRYYLSTADIRMDVLEESSTRTRCAYKGTARHWSVRLDGRVVNDVAWQYDLEVRREGEHVRGLIAFYGERVDLQVS